MSHVDSANLVQKLSATIDIRSRREFEGKRDVDGAPVGPVSPSSSPPPAPHSAPAGRKKSRECRTGSLTLEVGATDSDQALILTLSLRDLTLCKPMPVRHLTFLRPFAFQSSAHRY